MKVAWVILLLVAAVAPAGCSAISSPGVGGAAGAAVGGGGAALLSHGNPVAAGTGALAGALAGAGYPMAARSAYQRGLDDGYLQGSSDAVKRLFWDKQRLENPPVTQSPAEALLSPDGRGDRP